MTAPSSPTKIVRTGHDASKLTLGDGTLTLDVKFDQHDFSLTEVSPDGRETVVITARGKLRSVREGAPVFPKVSFKCQVSELSESSGGTVLDWIYKRAPFTGRVSTLTSHSTKDHTHLTFTMERGSSDETFLMEDVLIESWSFEEGDEGNVLSITGVVYGDIDLDGTTIHTALRA